MSAELLDELLREGKNHRPSRVALAWRDQEISYMSLDGQVDRISNSLYRRGIQPGDRVALYMHNIPHFVIAFYALQRLGAVAVPINIYWKERDLAHLLEISRVRGIITLVAFYEQIEKIRSRLPEIEWAVAIRGNEEQPEGSTSWEALLQGSLSEPFELESHNPASPALLAFTGGRTGPSRPVLLSHFNLLTNCQQVQDMTHVEFATELDAEEEARDEDGVPSNLNPHEVSLLTLPLDNLFSLNIGLNLSYMLTATAVLMERFEPAEALRLIDEHGCTLIFGSAAVFTEMVNAKEFESSNLHSVRYAFSYGAPVPDDIATKWKKKTHTRLFNCYGAAEASPLICCEAAGEHFSVGSIGPALPGVEVCLYGKGEASLEPGQVGELLARGPNITMGYFDPANPSQSINTKVDEWFATNDLALVEEGGNFHLLDRKEDTLRLANGDLVLPSDIEEVLLTHPGIWEACAFSSVDPAGFNRMVAFVVVNSNGKRLTEQELIVYCERRLANISRCPERIFLYNDAELPKLPNGAIWRRALRAELKKYTRN